MFGAAGRLNLPRVISAENETGAVWKFQAAPARLMR
jgi:hypothetical protein